jgi:UDP-glucuronate 4-epimerase
MPRVVVTGAAGFIGAHASAELLAQGWRVVGVDNFDPYYPRWLKERALGPLLAHRAFGFAEADVREPAVVDGLVRGAAAVVHLAARPGVRDSLNHAAAYRQANVAAIRAVLEGCVRTGVRRVVYASSSSVYGRSTPPFVELAPLPQPTSPYAAGKQEGEQLCVQFAERYGLRIAVLRLFSVYGPGQRPDQVMHAFARLLLAGRPLPIFGDGGSERDYTYVGDVARAVTAALSWSAADGKAAEVCNVGTGRSVRLDRLVALLSGALGVRPTIAPQPVHVADAPRTCADVGRARRVLGWAPEVTVEAGIAEFVRWYEVVYGREPVTAA